MLIVRAQFRIAQIRKQSASAETRRRAWRKVLDAYDRVDERRQPEAGEYAARAALQLARLDVDVQEADFRVTPEADGARLGEVRRRANRAADRFAPVFEYGDPVASIEAWIAQAEVMETALRGVRGGTESDAALPEGVEELRHHFGCAAAMRYSHASDAAERRDEPPQKLVAQAREGLERRSDLDLASCPAAVRQSEGASDKKKAARKGRPEGVRLRRWRLWPGCYEDRKSVRELRDTARYAHRT